MSSDKQELVPRLRFPEFRGTGGWSAFLGDALFDQITNKDHNSDLPVLAITQDQGAVPRDLIDYHVSVADSSIEGYKVVELGDFIISLRSFQGGIEYSRYRGICSPAYVILRLKPGHIPDYFRHLLKTDRFIAQMTRNLEGLRDGKMVSFKQFSELRLSTPKKNEQQKIAACLSSLDDLIAAEGKTLDTLMAYKKGLMQQLLPQEGETVPQLRFPEFRGAGDWVAEPIGSRLDPMSGFAFGGGDIQDRQAGTPLMRGINITEGYIRHNSEIDRFYPNSTTGLDAFLLKENDLVVGMDGSKVGKNSALVGKQDAGSLLVQRVARLRSENLATTKFVFQNINSAVFHGYVNKINTSGGIPHISLKQIADFAIFFPEDAEQDKIASFLSFLDHRMAAQAQKIDALKNHKKGLMQGLFPTVTGDAD